MVWVGSHAPILNSFQLVQNNNYNNDSKIGHGNGVDGLRGE